MSVRPESVIPTEARDGTLRAAQTAIKRKRRGVFGFATQPDALAPGDTRMVEQCTQHDSAIALAAMALARANLIDEHRWRLVRMQKHAALGETDRLPLCNGYYHMVQRAFEESARLRGIDGVVEQAMLYLHQQVEIGRPQHMYFHERPFPNTQSEQ